MFCALDKTFCASPNCDNSCGHKMTDRQKEIIESDPLLSSNVSYAYFYHKDDISNEIKKRIKLSIYAYAYEFENISLISDEEFDKLSKEINLNIQTNNELMDDFFNREFEPHTGSWIHAHPELDSIAKIYKTHYEK